MNAVPASIGYRVLGVFGAVATGVALWRFTSSDWLGGVIYSALVVAAAALHVVGQRRLKSRGGGRRY